MLDEFSLDVQPRLQNGEAERRVAAINDAAFNRTAMSATIAPYQGFVGSLRVTHNGDRTEIANDLRTLGSVVPVNFDPNERVTIEFTDASLNDILTQLLEGALGINYVAPSGLPTGISFRTEQPVPKSRVLQIVRDVLARNGLMMRFSNGVYQVGSPAEMAALQDGTAVGRTGEEVTRVVRLERANATDVIELATQLVPANVRVLATSTADSVVIQANPNDIGAVEQMVLTLSQSTVGSDKIAIIPLLRSAPEAAATQLNQLYAPSLRPGEGTVTVVPLQNQQAILVRTSDPSLMAGIQQVARQIDRSVTDVADLRAIALTNLRAVDLAPQLAQIFGSVPTYAEASPEASAEDVQASLGVRSRLRAPKVNTPSDNEDGTELMVGATPIAAAPGDDLSKGNAGAPVLAAPQDGETRIVADARSNAILVHSTYTVYKRMREVIQTLDVAQAQVIIEATVLEVKLNDRLETGVQFFLQSNGIVVGSGIPAGNQVPHAGGVLGVSTSIGTVTVDALVKVLRGVTAVKVVSSPYLTVLDGETARLMVGDQIPFVTTSQTSDNGGNVTVTQNVDILDTGVVLQITPRIHANNSVDLNIVQSVSTPVPQLGKDNLTPTIATRDMASRILAQSGRTLLLGGLIQDRVEKSETGVPGVSRLPVVGRLFKQNTASAQRTELLVLITPRVVRSSSEIEGITRMLQGAKTHMQVMNSLPDLKSP
ncbi:secretin N-terminal domain-containing protein [Mesorhizobium sp. ANAO-SY3R2]|uniref:secretin N-terminal domain-containing protein n=1 Tax=Mesorhizobium sp. ANAO-SY3R2 TaxID=3166644 RepID=UPI0036705B78